MNNSLKIIQLIILVLLSACKSFDNDKVISEGKVDDSQKTIISTYVNGNVTLFDVNVELEKLIAQNPKLKGITFDKLSSDQKEAIIKEVVLKEMAYHEAKKRGLNQDQEFKKALKVFETELLKQRLLIDITKKATDEKNVKKSYDQLVVKSKDKKDYRISYILVKLEEEAKSIHQALIKYPMNFQNLARKKSLDKELAKKNGDLGFVNEDSLPIEIVNLIKSLDKNQIASPIAIGDKWVVVKLEDYRPAEIAPYEKIKDNLAQSLSQKAIEEFLKSSLNQAKISIILK